MTDEARAGEPPRTLQQALADEGILRYKLDRALEVSGRIIVPAAAAPALDVLREALHEHADANGGMFPPAHCTAESCIADIVARLSEKAP